MPLLERARSDDRPILDLLSYFAEPLPALESPEFGARFERFGDAKIVLLGEATHGTSEFYRARAAISRSLIERNGLNVLSGETESPDAPRMQRLEGQKPHAPSEEQSFARF